MVMLAMSKVLQSVERQTAEASTPFTGGEATLHGGRPCSTNLRPHSLRSCGEVTVDK